MEGISNLQLLQLHRSLVASVVKEDQNERLDALPKGFDLAAGKLATLSPSTFMNELNPCVVKKLTGTDPKILAPGVANLAAILVVHGMKLTDRAEKLRGLFAEQGLQNWSFIEAYDGDAIDPEALRCFFGPWVDKISGDSCCNRESSSLKPHLAFLSMVKLNLTGALLVEDDLVVVPGADSVRSRLEKAAAMLPGCDLVRVAPFAVGYMVSNAGARKFLHYSLRRGGKKISNPMDWQMDEINGQGYDGFRYCEGPETFTHWGHGTNQGGHRMSAIELMAVETRDEETMQHPQLPERGATEEASQSL